MGTVIRILSLCCTWGTGITDTSGLWFPPLLLNAFMQTSTTLTYSSMSHETHQELGSSCCLALLAGKCQDVEGEWSNSQSVCLGLHQWKISSTETTQKAKHKQIWTAETLSESSQYHYCSIYVLMLHISFTIFYYFCKQYRW